MTKTEKPKLGGLKANPQRSPPKAYTRIHSEPGRDAPGKRILPVLVRAAGKGTVGLLKEAD